MRIARPVYWTGLIVFLTLSNICSRTPFVCIANSLDMKKGFPNYYANI